MIVGKADAGERLSEEQVAALSAAREAIRDEETPLYLVEDDLPLPEPAPEPPPQPAPPSVAEQVATEVARQVDQRVVRLVEQVVGQPRVAEAHAPKRWRKTPVRDEDMRILYVDVVEVTE